MIRTDWIAHLWDIFYIDAAPQLGQRLPDPADDIAYAESKTERGQFLVPQGQVWRSVAQAPYVRRRP